MFFLFCWLSLPVFMQKLIFIAAFVDVNLAFDSVHIPTLVSYLALLNIPHALCNYISSLFSQRFITFTSPSGIISEKLTYRDLSQGSCLNSLLFKIYMSFICHSLTSPNFQIILYADDIVLFSNKNS